MNCAKCGAKLPAGLDAEYCLICRERADVLNNWIDKIMEEKMSA